MLQHALKEWAVICQALTEGHQTILLRKGGVVEARDAFHVEHRRFWLLPTFVHQQDEGITKEATPLLETARKGRPPHGILRLSLAADVAAEWFVSDLDRLLRLSGLHFWSEATVRSRFAYRQPGLHVLAIRVARLASPIEIADRPEYAGCRSWVELAEPLPSTDAMPVLGDNAFHRVLDQLSGLLRSDALA